MTGRTRTRLERERASLAIAQLALQQIEDDLTADEFNASDLTANLRELQDDIDVPGGLFPALAQLVTATARRAQQIQPDRDGSPATPGGA
ncbi:hypothetical protein ACF1G0_33030 [Streptomyces sp. NPDC013953]|uniref:hypothetical protein n=1 Tax=Streptomyces sp. NPDC013953 TaxID=3364868 RepID=UPI0036F5C0FD